MNKHIEKWFSDHQKQIVQLAQDIFEHPELSGEEAYACQTTAQFMEQFGFFAQKITVPPAKVENGVIATWGSGKPVIGILGEYDALPNLGQEAVPYYAPKPGPGHGCGHCLMNAGCASAAVAVKTAMEMEQIPGTIVYLACPAEEAGSGKVRMLHDGGFDGIDICIAWHTGGPFRVLEGIGQAIISAEFFFRGKASHAAMAPQNGRSALDAAQLMNLGVEFLREHVEEGTRIHYAFGSTSDRANIVPEYTSVKYSVRSHNRVELDQVFARIIDIARGAALMTGTTSSYKLTGGSYETQLNFTLNQVLYSAAQKVPPIEYDLEDYDFAKTLYRNYNGTEVPETLDMGNRAHIFGKCDVLPTHFCTPLGQGWPETFSSDVNDVSQVIPTVQLCGGGNIGVGGHSWGVTASSGSTLGHKAAIQAGKYLAQFCVDVLENPEIVEQSITELRNAQKNRTAYRPLLPSEKEIML